MLYILYKNSAVRLVDGDNKYSGQVEVLHNGTWGTVCHRRFGMEEATVVCRQIGLEATSAPVFKYVVRSKSLPILLSYLECKGDEDSLLACYHHGIGVHRCSHTEDADVICKPPRKLNSGTAGEY